ncbi:dhhc zinc finger domain containing protein [Stylonychia lemnae]|uniref:Palmitoyltransferase n=1 Tax=Stylonychia lemnae TaxID=5949 RepID=A0A078B0R1_STYLE|nr:dhhc zinc finger domain containing protein [Stylonychia lemnae]|eukprot:CDW86703.1 dhhc zinc finger domain containing protein [Stylonychia lemnae]
MNTSMWSAWRQRTKSRLYCRGTQFRDPGVLGKYPLAQLLNVDPYLSYSNINTQMLYNSFTSDDVQTINDDEVFQRADIYNPRYCDTCQIQRPPKSSHCRLCNNCVRGFDQTFKNTIRVALFMTGIAQGAISIFAFQYPRYILFNALLFGAFIYLLAIKDMFIKYLNLVQKNLTFKEKMSRYEACMTYNMKDKFKDHVTCSQRTKNLFRFLFRKGNYKSAIEYK